MLLLPRRGPVPALGHAFCVTFMEVAQCRKVTHATHRFNLVHLFKTEKRTKRVEKRAL